ncbi:hypothetical protein ACFUGD_00385 [Streptomyces sp. NPDC057217]|uniref:hypothetical protein n=1 Tax=Streptomyces sp. NPDC057217 TaxID=3346054 RepID=UPI003627835E
MTNRSLLFAALGFLALVPLLMVVAAADPEQAQRQRELIAIRRGKGSRPPQHLTEAEYDQWLVEADYKRRKVLRRYGLGRQLPKPSRRYRGRECHQTVSQVRPKLFVKGSGRRRRRPKK